MQQNDSYLNEGLFDKQKENQKFGVAQDTFELLQ